MNNETLFFAQIFLVVGMSLYACRLGAAALTAWVALQAVFANLFVMKQIELFGLGVTCSDSFMIGSLFSLNFLSEFWGKEAATRAIQLSFFAMLFFVFASQIHLAYAPAPFDFTHGAFQSILFATPRIVAASIGVMWFVQQIDLQIFRRLRQRLGEDAFVFRVGLSLVISQTIDTVLFSYLGLYGVIPSMGGVIGMSLAVKAVAIACSTPFTSFARRFVRS